MSDGFAPWQSQAGFEVRLCWGPSGAEALAPDVGVVVLVDILRFTTALDVAVATGARVFPEQWPPTDDGRSDLPAEVEVADGTGPRGLSLSPASLTQLGPDDQILLPSANGSHCSALAARTGAVVVGGALRNAAAVAAWLKGSRRAGPAGPIAVVPCGERWPDGSLRPAVEDLIGAGAVIAALSDRDVLLAISPEALAAAAAYRAARSDLLGALTTCSSGRELVAVGNGADIARAAVLNVSRAVPVLGADGAYADAASG